MPGTPHMHDSVEQPSDPTFEERAGAEKIVDWFHTQGFEIDATAPRFDGDWAVEIFTTEECLSGFPHTPHEPYPNERTFRLATKIINYDDDDGIDYVSGLWWDAKQFYDEIYQ